MLTWFAVLLALAAAAQAHRRCGNLACSHALSLVRFNQDFTAPDGSFFARGTTVTVFSKDGSEWETEARCTHFSESSSVRHRSPVCGTSSSRRWSTSCRCLCQTLASRCPARRRLHHRRPTNMYELK